MWVLRKWHILRNRRIWQGLRQWNNKTGILTVGDLHKNGKFEKMGNWARIHQRSGKTSFEVTKRGILRKGRFRQIWRVCQKNHQGFGQIFKWDDKKGHVDSWRFLGQWQILQIKDGEFGKKLSKVWQKFTKRWQKGASWQMAIITKMANWATIHSRFAKIQMRWQTKHVDNCEFYENDKFGKNL